MMLLITISCAAAPPSPTGCQSPADLAGSFGRERLLLGAAVQDDTASNTPLDIRYAYLAGGLSDDGPCNSCASSCTTNGVSCATGGGCGWWGCWQWDQLPPGEYVRSFLERAEEAGQIPMFTWYELLQSSGGPESELLNAVQNPSLMQNYFAHWRFLLENIGSSDVLLHIEPDFWGFAQQKSSNPHKLPAQVAAVNPEDCADQEDTVAGLGRCMITMAHKYAPRARVALHASGWSTRFDVLNNRDKTLNIEDHAQQTANFLLEAGAALGEFIVLDASDRDAGYYELQGRDTWWRDDGALPNLDQALRWSSALHKATSCPTMWWQVPVGNENLPNAPYQYRDNRVRLFLDNLSLFPPTGTFALGFGAGEATQTNPETDGGYLTSRITQAVEQGTVKLK